MLVREKIADRIQIFQKQHIFLILNHKFTILIMPIFYTYAY